MSFTTPSPLTQRWLFTAVSGLISGLIMLAGFAMAWGRWDAKLERAIKDIEYISRSSYTHQNAAIEIQPLHEAIRLLQREDILLERRIIRLEHEAEIMAPRPPSRFNP